MNYRKLKEIMKDRGYTVADLARICKVPVGTLSKIVCGITANPGYDTMAAISQALDCSMDEFSERGPLMPYYYEDYLFRFENLPSCQKEFVKYTIDLEYDRMLHMKSRDKIPAKCFEFTHVIEGKAEYTSQVVHNILVDRNPLTEKCTYYVWIRSNNLAPKFFQDSLLGFYYADEMNPRQGEIWMFLTGGLLFIGRVWKCHGKIVLKSLNGTVEDMIIENPLRYKRMGRYMGWIDFPGNPAA